MNRRRTLLNALGAGALMAPFSSLAQPPGTPAGPPGKIWRIGILPGGPLATRQYQWDAFVAQMRKFGYVEGKNVRYDFRAPQQEGTPNDDQAIDLARLEPDVIVATGANATAAAKKAAPRTPIVMCPSADPVGQGLVASLRRPGGNITGVSLLTRDTTGKRMQLLHEMVPGAQRFGFVWNAPTGKAQVEAAEAAARQLGVRLLSLETASAAALPATFDAAVKAGVQALVIAAEPFTFGLRNQIAALALKHRLPSIAALPAVADAGGLMTYGPNDLEYFRRAAVYVDKIIKGANPAELPVEQPTLFEMVVNMKTAKAMGIKVPQVVLLQAHRVIE